MSDENTQTTGSEIIQFPSQVDEAQFINAASDAKGHSERLWFRVQPMYGNVLDVIVQSRKFPYRTRGDLLRHALIRHLRWLEAQQPISGKLGALEATNALLRDVQFWDDFRNFIEKLNVQVNMLKGQGDIGEARRLVLETLDNMKAIPEGYWKRKYLEQIRRDHREILDNLPSADLLNFEDDMVVGA